MKVLYLCNPLQPCSAQMKTEHSDVTALVFHENERWLPKARQAFVQGRFSAVAAEGHACAIALALAALLPVEEALLFKCALFKREAYKNAPAQLRRIAVFARRNLALVVACMRLADTDEYEIRRIQNAASSYAQVESDALWPFFARK